MMMYGKSRPRVILQQGNLRLQRRVLMIVCAALLIAVIILTVAVIRNSVFRRQTQTQLSQRMVSAAASAVDEVNRMSSIATSSTNARLARVRQYVYCMEQFNLMSIALSGESGRLASNEAFTALYADLETFEAQTQSATTSTLDTRANLLSHLSDLQSGLLPN